MAIEINRVLTREEIFALAQLKILEIDVAVEIDDLLNAILRQKVNIAKQDLVKERTVESLLP